MPKNTVTPKILNSAHQSPSAKLFSIGQAAKHLKVSIQTLRRWESAGKITPIRNKQNQRLFHLKDLENLKNTKYAPLPAKIDSDKTYTIGQAAKKIGVSIQTLRRWEKQNKTKFKRNQSGHRIFTPQDIRVGKELKKESSSLLPPPSPILGLPSGLPGQPAGLPLIPTSPKQAPAIIPPPPISPQLSKPGQPQDLFAAKSATATQPSPPIATSPLTPPPQDSGLTTPSLLDTAVPIESASLPMGPGSKKVSRLSQDTPFYKQPWTYIGAIVILLLLFGGGILFNRLRNLQPLPEEEGQAAGPGTLIIPRPSPTATTTTTQGEWPDIGRFLSGQITIGSDEGQLVSIDDQGDLNLSQGDANIGGDISLDGIISMIPQTAPPTASAGDIYFDSTTNTLKYYDGSKWINLDQSSSTILLTSLQEAYEAGSTINTASDNIIINLTDQVTDASLVINALGDQSQFLVTGNSGENLLVIDPNATIPVLIDQPTSITGNLNLGAGLTDDNLTSAIPLSDSGNTTLPGGATSIIGGINEAYNNTGSGGNYWTDGGDYLKPTSNENLRIYGPDGTDYAQIKHTGSNIEITNSDSEGSIHLKDQVTVDSAFYAENGTVYLGNAADDSIEIDGTITSSVGDVLINDAISSIDYLTLDSVVSIPTGTTGRIYSDGTDLFFYDGTASSYVDLTETGGSDADTLDGLDSLQFLRSDTSDTFTSGTLTIFSAANLDINGGLSVGDTSIDFDAAATTFNVTGDLTLTLGGGDLVLNDQITNIDLIDTTQGALNFETDLLSLDTLNNYVGINTTTPTSDLDIAGSASLSGVLSFRGTTDPKINLLNGETLGIQTSTGGDAGLSEVFTILNSGYLGIGDTTPTAHLVVGSDTLAGYATGSGDLYVQDILEVDGSFYLSNTLVDPTALWENTLNVYHPAGAYAAIADFTIGGTSTASAQLHVNATTGELTLAGTLDANGIVELGDGADAITLNGSSITLTGFASCALETDGSGVVQCGVDDAGGGGGGNWTLNESAGTIFPINETVDMLIGGNSTASGVFQVFANTGNVQLDGNLTVDGGNINFGANTTIGDGGDDITFSIKDDSSTGFRIMESTTTYFQVSTANNTESIIIGNAGTNPDLSISGSGQVTITGNVDANGGVDIINNLTVNGSSLLGDGGTTNYLEVSNTGDITFVGSADTITATNPGIKIETTSDGYAALTVNQGSATESADIFSASSSGVTRFRIANNGYTYAQRYADIADDSYYVDPAAADYAAYLAGDVYIEGGDLTIVPQSTTTRTDEGNIYYDTEDNHLFVYSDFNDTGLTYHRIAMDMTKYSTSSAALANQAYIEIAHNQTTTDISLTGWFYDSITNLWKSITDRLAKLIDHDLDNEYNPEFTKEKKTTSVSLQLDQSSFGTGNDGAIIITTGVDINTDDVIAGRNCPDGGDAVNYSASSFPEENQVELTSPPNANCLAANDEVLLINLEGTSTTYGNVGNWETLRVQSVNGTTVTFESNKLKCFGDGTGGTCNSNLGTANGTQRVMLQRVPNYTNVTVNTGTNFYPSTWDGSKNGVMFFRATGAVSVNGTGKIHANALGYRGGSGGGSYADGGESFCDNDGGGDGGHWTTPAWNGLCGGGGAGGGRGDTSQYTVGGSGTASLGGGGGGGGRGYDSTGEGQSLPGGSGGGGYGTAGLGGKVWSGGGTVAGTAGGTSSSGAGGRGGYDVTYGAGGGGGGGGTYGDADLTRLMFGSAAGQAGYGYSVNGATGGHGGGIVYIAANSTTVSGTGYISSDGGNGGDSGGSNSSGSGGGAGGSVKLVGDTLTLGSSRVTADYGLGATASAYDGGNGGDGRIAVEYASSITGTSSPSYETSTLVYNDYAVYISEEVHTPETTAFNNISWTEDLPSGTEIQMQTRSGATADSTDGTWEEWKTATVSATINNGDDHTDWSTTYMTVSEGDVARNIDYFEDEDENNSANLTKIATASANGYTQDIISLADLTNYTYITFWFRSSKLGDIAQFSFGENDSFEQVASVSADIVDSWQKYYWDIRSIPNDDKDEVDRIRWTLNTDVELWFDSIKAERYHSDNGDAIASTANEYIQYRTILSTVNTINAPTLSEIRVNLTNANGTQTIDADRIRDPNEIIRDQSSRPIDPEKLDYDIFTTGTGNDGAIIITTGVDINTDDVIDGRNCPDGGDAVNYNVTALTNNTATLNDGVDNGCIDPDEEVLLINLEGTSSYYDNVGNWETLRVQSVSGSEVTFRTNKTKYYGDGASDDSNLGTANGTQRVMLQRVPNYTNVTVNTGTNFYPSTWDGSKNGVMFFRATGAVSVNGTGKIHANALGYRGGSGGGSYADGGESFCDNDGGGDGGHWTTPAWNGLCGGGGAGGGRGDTSQYTVGGSGTASLGGGGGGGGRGYDSTGEGQSLPGGSGGGGYGTAGLGGKVWSGGGTVAGTAGGTSSSGAGGRGGYDVTYGAGGGGGGGGTYGDADLTRLMFGSAAGQAGYGYSVNGATGGHGGGIVYIAANSTTVSSTGYISSDGGDGGNSGGSNSSGSGGGAGGSVKLVGDTLTLGSSRVTADYGVGATASAYDGGDGGDGRVALFYETGMSGSTSPAHTFDTNTSEYNPYEIWISKEISTNNADSYGNIEWTQDLDTNGMIELQTRSGATSDSTNGTWEDWKPSTVSTNYTLLRDMDDETSEDNWSETNLSTTVDGNITRNVDYYEDEDESTVANTAKFGSIGSSDGYAEASIPQAGGSIDLTGYDYISAWLYATSAGELVELGFGENAGNEATQSATIETANTWQKVYWDITDLTSGDCTGADGCNNVDIFRITIRSTNTTLYVDSIKAEKDLLETAAGSAIPSTANDYLQYRAILTSTNIFNSPTLSEVRINYNDGSAQILNDRLANQNDIDTFDNTIRLIINEIDLDDYKSARIKKQETSFLINADFSPGTGADGDITVSANTDTNAIDLIANRNCSEGGDAVNYNVTALTSRMATVDRGVSTSCITVGDEVLLINLEGASTAFLNVGNYETLRVERVVGEFIYFTTAKTKYYGDNSKDDTNLGTANGTQRVMLQRVPNYNNVTVQTGYTFYPADWNGSKNGVMFFRAKGAVAINGTLYADFKGYRGGAGSYGDGGESFCDEDGGGDGGHWSLDGSDGLCGGGGAGGGRGDYSESTPGGDGTTDLGGGGGGGGYGYDSTGDQQSLPGGGAGAGYGSFGTKGKSYTTLANNGVDGGINSSGDGGDGGYDVTYGAGGGGGGGGTYGDADLTRLMFGSGGGEAGYDYGLNGADGGDGGGIIFIAANSITVNGIISNDGGAGASSGCGSNCSGSGGGAGGSIKLIGNTVNTGGTDPTGYYRTAAYGGAFGDTTYDGGTGGVGRIAIEYTSTLAGASSPTANTTSSNPYNYAVFISDEIPTPNATEYTRVNWRADEGEYSTVQVQTRSGASNNSTDGTWDEWRPATPSANTVVLDNANTHTNWTASESTLTVADGDITRDVNFYEDEDESTVGNLTKLTVDTNANTYAEARIASTDLSNYDFITAWVYATQSGNTVKLSFGETSSNEHEALLKIDSGSVWQKAYWDISHIPYHERDEVRNLRITAPSTNYIIYFDNFEAERLLNNPAGSTITSIPNEYLQYRVILASSNPGYFPTLYNIQAEWSNGFKIEQTDSDTVRLYNYSGEVQQMRLDAIVFGADLAEWYTVDDESIEAGDVVASTGEVDSFGVPILRKATGGDDKGLIGSISTRAGQELGLETPDRRLLGLSGRIPIKIDPKSPSIRNGDYITASPFTAGLGYKASIGDISIGRAFANWDTPENGEDTTTVMTFITQPQNTPLLAPEVLGNFIIEKYGDAYYAVKNTDTDKLIKPVTAFASAMVGNLKAGIIQTQELVANTITLEGEDASLISPIAQIDQVKTDLISPLSDNNLTIDLSSPDASDSGFGSLIVQGNLEVTGDSTVSGDLSVTGLSRLNDVEANTLYADNIQSPTITHLEDQDASQSSRLALLEDKASSLDTSLESYIDQILADSSPLPEPTLSDTSSITSRLDGLEDWLNYSDSSSLNSFIREFVDSHDIDATASSYLAELNQTDAVIDTTSIANDQILTTDNLTVTSFATINAANFTTGFSVGHELTFTSNTLGTTTDTLFIQPTGQLNLLAGLMTLDDTGQVIITGDLTVTGLAKLNQVQTTNLRFIDTTQPTLINGFAPLLAANHTNLELKLASSSALVVKSAYDNPVAAITASGSAYFKDLSLSSSASGTIIVPSGEKATSTTANSLKDTSQVIVTFEGDYSPATKYWITKDVINKRFTLHLNYPVSNPVKASWLIIN